VAVLSMSKQEFSRLDALLQVQSGRLRVTDACVLIGLLAFWRLSQRVRGVIVFLEPSRGHAKL
jgi:hypothetical protein